MFKKLASYHRLETSLRLIFLLNKHNSEVILTWFKIENHINCLTIMRNLFIQSCEIELILYVIFINLQQTKLADRAQNIISLYMQSSHTFKKYSYSNYLNPVEYVYFLNTNYLNPVEFVYFLCT